MSKQPIEMWFAIGMGGLLVLTSAFAIWYISSIYQHKHRHELFDVTDSHGKVHHSMRKESATTTSTTFVDRTGHVHTFKGNHQYVSVFSDNEVGKNDATTNHRKIRSRIPRPQRASNAGMVR